MPLGEHLLERIASAVSFKSNHYDVDGGSRDLWRAMCIDAQERGKTTSEYYAAALRLRDAAHLGLSIDNIVHQQYGDELLVRVAKMAIADQLLKAENDTDLRLHRDRQTITWPKVRSTWLGRFAQILVQDFTTANVHKIFKNVSIISFNYDRTVRRFLPLMLTSQFAVPDSVAQDIARSLQIYHPYGSLGHLPWEGVQGGVEFGLHDHSTVGRVSQNIKTFTEHSVSAQSSDVLKGMIESAEQIIFLGFGYISQNMELLTKGIEGSASRVIGTALGLSDPDQETVMSQLNNLHAERFRHYKSAYLRPLKCEEFLRENFRSIATRS